jgi:hypothetical protein
VIRVYVTATVVRATPAGFFIFAVAFVTVNVIVVASGDVRREGILTQAGLNKTTERDSRQRGSKKKSSFRTHARDEKELFQAMQAFLLHFCNLF